MKNQARDQLRELLQQKVEAASELAVREKGNIPADLIKDISSFKQLVELHQSVAPPSSSGKRWVVPVMLITTLIITSALLFVHLPDARVDLDLITSTVAFTLDESQDLASNVRVLSISASGLERVDMSALDAPGQPDPSNPGGTDSIRLSLPSNEKGTITLEKIQLPARTRVTLETLDGSNRFRVAWKLPRNESPRPLSLSVLGDVQVGLSASPPKVLHLSTPTGLEMIPGSDVVLELDLPGNSELAIEPQLPVSMLSFATVHESVGAESSARQVSTIRSGTVFIQSLNGQKYDLRAGERLRFSDSKGEVQKTTLRPNAISVQYEGKVWGMNAGSHEYPTSLMPSLLEWLRARHGLSLLWGSTLYVTGMLMVVLRWFRMID
jgi:hypothetical protein